MRILRVVRKSRVALFIFAVAILLLMHACTGSELYYRFRKINQAEWSRDAVLIFHSDSIALPHSRPLEVSLEVTSNNRYPYRDLWLLLEHNLTDTLFVTDTIQVFLADKNGHHLGNSVGTLHQLSVPWLRLNQIKNNPFQIRISQLMTDDPLVGIERVGVKIMPTVKSSE